ncbi:MAG TPA: DUF2252 domain-containing protein [Nocardioidaceae bacterium]|nr:DUF2252 domain-containing protein [Nocardioidaceae bacterium]
MVTRTQARRQELIIEVLQTAFSGLMHDDPHAFRVKFRKMAANPFAFYRGSAALFYADMAEVEDAWVDDRASRVWIHGDLHAENFGTYQNSHGRMVFDVNDFDEAYIGHFSWDLRRFAASMALMGWQKALPEKAVRSLVGRYLRSYLAQVTHYASMDEDDDFALHLDNTEGPVLEVLIRARLASRVALLDGMTRMHDNVRVFDEDATVRRLGKAERRKVERAFGDYLDTIPESKKFDRALFYEVRDVVGKAGFGIGSAGLPAYNVLVEGYSQSLDNDVVLSMKQANVPAISRFVDTTAADGYFEHEGHRTVVSQRALQVHTDPLLGYTSLDGVGYVVSEVSPYEFDLDWGEVNEPEEMASVVHSLGRATAKVHCASDEDSDQHLVTFQTEEAICAVVEGRRREFVSDLTDFAMGYAGTVRTDHALFVDAFREGRIGGVRST